MLFDLEQLFRDGYQYKKARVILMALSDAAVFQGSFFQNAESDECPARLMRTLDVLNCSHGQGTVQLDSAGMHPRWAMLAEIYD